MSRGWYSYPLIHVDYADERAGGEGRITEGGEKDGKVIHRDEEGCRERCS